MLDHHRIYEGDEALGRLLAQHGIPADVTAIRGLVAGIAAAPPAVDRQGWLQLVAPRLDAAVAAQLLALEAEMRQAQAAALERRPSPAKRLVLLRRELAQQGFAGFIVPRGDEHQGEYVPSCAERLAWLTGFTGSAGLAIVLAEKAAIFVDGRYTLQVRAETEAGLYEARHLVDDPPATWITANLPPGARLGYDPWLHTPGEIERYAAAAVKAGACLEPCARNPVDAVWSDQPPAPISPIVPHPLRFSGRSAAEKRAELGASLAVEKIDAVVLTAPDSIAWLLNIRGADVPHTPLPLSFAVARVDGSVELFCDLRKLSPPLAEHLGNAVRTVPRDSFPAALDRLGAEGRRILVDPGTVPAFVTDRLKQAGAELVRGADPCALPKACKNPVELEGIRAAHRRDGAALTRFLAWIKREAVKGGLTEMAAAERLAAFRREGEHFRDLSFPTIAGAGPDGAVVHYRVSAATDRQIEPGTLFLVDSGAQYLDGTTDVTRTLAIGVPNGEMRNRFTRVLKGHIALATTQFPEGTSGSQLDVLARHSLWQAGLDYDHGTGHGVGSYLGVHEGPQRISKVPNTVALRPGMIVSNEPGYYKPGEYGIRIENLVAVRAADKGAGAERRMMCFETLTLAPIDRDLIELNLMTAGEIAWLDAYHARVRDTLAPLLDRDANRWLEGATQPLAA
ncbi:MAG TPA: aminopeptidase P family protein [Alphaproteobacteria bacterium]|nr:aminopeptidase P family protein [Alphaproteobacteria bacterium]